MDGRSNNGGHKTAGRKSKADEQKLIEKLTPLDEKAFKALEEGINAGHNWAVKLYFEYRYGKPQQSLEVTTPEKISIPVIEWVKPKETFD